MISTEGIKAVATITELRADTAGVLDTVQQIGGGILIQKNNEACAVVLSVEEFTRLLAGQKKK